MKNDETQQELKRIEQAVSVITDPMLRAEAFKKLLDISFPAPATGEKTPSRSQAALNTEVNKEKPASTEDVSQENLLALCKQIGVTPDQVHAKFDLQPDGIRIYSPPDEPTRTKLQLEGLKVLSILLKKVYDFKTVNATELLGKSKLPTERIDNLNNNDEYKRLFTGTARALQLTWQGEKECLEALKNYLTGVPKVEHK